MIWDGEKLKALCGARGIAKSKLATELGVSRPTVYGWLAGQVPKGDHLLKLCAMLSVDPSELFSGVSAGAIPENYPVTTGAEQNRGKLFKKSGIKLIHLFLSDPRLDQEGGNDLLNVSVRELASEAGMSTGSISELLSEMKERGFLLTDGRYKRLVNRKELFDQWLHGYMDYRFKVKKQCFDADRITWWKDRKPEREGFLWGGEPAAAILTDDFLRPQKLTLYTDEPLYDLVVDGNLHRVSTGGNVEFIEPGLKTGGENGCVHPLLVYADLICSSDDRNTETATRIYARYLRQIIESA